jgi:hypothetical protein
MSDLPSWKRSDSNFQSIEKGFLRREEVKKGVSSSLLLDTRREKREP